MRFILEEKLQYEKPTLLKEEFRANNFVAACANPSHVKPYTVQCLIQGTDVVFYDSSIGCADVLSPNSTSCGYVTYNGQLYVIWPKFGSFTGTSGNIVTGPALGSGQSAIKTLLKACGMSSFDIEHLLFIGIFI